MADFDNKKVNENDDNDDNDETEEFKGSNTL